MNVCVLIIILFFVLFVAYILFDRDLMAPPCIFCIAFIISGINLFMNIKYWAVDFKFITIAVVSIGVCSFIFGSYIGKRISLTSAHSNIVENRYLNYNGFLANIWILFELVVMFFVMRYLVSRTGAGNLFDAITIFRNASFTDEVISFPFLLNQCYFVCRMSGYVWAYIGVNNYFCKGHIDWKIVICYLLSMTMPFFSGERGSIIELLLGTAALVVVFNSYKVGERKRIKFKYVVLVIIAGALAVYAFTWVGTLIGREVLSAGETISMYLGAPLLNLNTWLQLDYTTENFWDHRTLAGVIDLIRGFFDDSLRSGNSGFIYRKANGHMVGNVYTTFGTFYYDLKIWGVIIFSALMGAISERIYVVCKKRKKDSHISYIAFCYFYPLIFLSFFSNRFFVVFDELLIKSIIVWFVLILLFIKVKIKIRGY